ncbi:HNH endonuclease [Pseudomonas sp. LF19]|uniref:HNH endonuclease n=1 Tax=Pseudomonas sp. LF19 TaxID=2899115 RepID=UPI001F481D91|nr:HNH endonuclease signature motif containing protein [Pseudomonas sp. LF19]MCE5981973.1 HNH endonuclease [Pseudomonas sp. LF19]
MSSAPRVFRGPESIAAEALSRDAIPPFLNDRGYTVIADERIPSGRAVQQFVSVRSPDGQELKIRVRLCWRRGGRNPNEKNYAAAQLTARLRSGGWDATLEYLAERDRHHGITHNLLIQRDGDEFIYAALLPVEAVSSIWHRQREVSNELQRRGSMGRIRKNHAENGSSPTLWLQDNRTPDSHQVPDSLWQWPNVIDLAKIIPQVERKNFDDTFDDCPSPDYSALGRDEGSRLHVVRSEVRRDPRVRSSVLERASACEREGCGASRNFAGFLDVHHILGVEKSDRVWNCVALCPNCHREAHFSPYATELNMELLKYSEQFKH